MAARRIAARPGARHADPEAAPDGDLAEVAAKRWLVARRDRRRRFPSSHGRLPGVANRCCEGGFPGSAAARARRSVTVTRLHSVPVAAPARGSAGTAVSRPHHSLSRAGLIGGGGPPKPGELSLAHHGVLFLDELAEYRRDLLDGLREPLEAGSVWISRASGTARFPSRPLLVAAMNPCKCGWLGHPVRACRCTPTELQQYAARLSDRC